MLLTPPDDADGTDDQVDQTTPLLHQKLTTQAGLDGHERALLNAIGITHDPGTPEAVAEAAKLRHATDGKALRYEDPMTHEVVTRPRTPGAGGNFDMLVIDRVAHGDSLSEAHDTATIVAKMNAARMRR